MMVDAVSNMPERSRPADQVFDEAARQLTSDAALKQRQSLQGNRQMMKKADVQGLVDSVAQNLQTMNDTHLAFKVHEASGEVMVTVTNEETGEVVREIPPSEVLDLAAKFDEMVGIIFDQRG